MDVSVMGQGLTVAICVALALRVLHPLARRYRFVDMPDQRKRHRRPTPLIGGYGVLIGVVLALAFGGFLGQPLWWIFLGTLAALTVLGSIDDAYEVSARLRFLFQGIVVLAALWSSGLVIENLGLLMGHTNTGLGFTLGLVFTLLCALATINAYNMIDGIDGLAASQAALTLVAVLMLAVVAGRGELALFAGLVALALAVFKAFNLELPFFRGRKAFLGDGGSTALGFLILWSLVFVSQRDPLIRPITAVWLVGLPIVDMLAVFARRAIAGQSPFHADRGHIHHLLMARGLSARTALVVLAMVQALLVGIGVAGEWLAWTEFTMTVAAIGTGIAYLLISVLLANGVDEAERMPVRSGS